MIYLLLSILSSASIYTIFKVIDRQKIDLLTAVVINYFTAAMLGYLISPTQISLSTFVQYDWLWLTIVVGSLFVSMFLFIGYATKRVGITRTSVATRLSMIIPIVVSLSVYEKAVSITNIILLLGSVVIVVIATLPQDTERKSGSTWSTILPIILFIGSGSIDALVKVAQASYVPDQEIELFSGILFSVSFLLSFIVAILSKQQGRIPNVKTICFGVLLGSVNYGSLYFMMKALTHSGIESSNVFAINNLGIVLLSIVIGVYLFGEKLSNINKIGVTLASAIILLLL